LINRHGWRKNVKLKPWAGLLILLAGAPLEGQQFVSVGYYCAWNYHAYAPRDIMYGGVSHIAHAFIWPTAHGDIESYQDMHDAELVEYAHDEDKKVLISVGGWGQSRGFASMAADETSRGRFVSGIVSYIRKYGYDGADLDWEYPDRSGSDSSNYNRLVKELHSAFQAENKGWIITMAVPSGDYYGTGFDFTTLSRYVEWFGIMAYDMFGSWCSRAGHNAPLFPPEVNNNGSAHDAVLYFTGARSIPRQKLVLGIPLYGIGCLAAGYNAWVNGGFAEYQYKEIVPLVDDSYMIHWDETACVPYCTNTGNSHYITYDDTHSVRLKCEYAGMKNLRGVMMWALGHDDTGRSQPLLETVRRYVESLSGTGLCKSPDTSGIFTAVNFPNPFNTSTAVAFCLAEPCHVTVRVFDVKGRQAALLFNGMGRKGWNRTVFDAPGLPSGMYLYTITAGRIRHTGNMALIR